MTPFNSKIIDFHVHLFPDRLFDAIWNYFTAGYGWDIQYRLYTDRCLEYLYSAGVEKIVYSNYAHKPGVAAKLNEWNLALLDSHPDLYCFAAYHPGDDDAYRMAERILEHPRVLGFKLHLLVQGFFPHDERLFPLYEHVMTRKKRFLFHTGTGPVGNRFVGVDEFKKLLHRYPDLPANIAHMGGNEYREFMDLLDDHPLLMFDTAFTFMPGYEHRFNLDPQLLEKYSDRIVYGSDFPNLVFPREIEIKQLHDYGLSDDFYRKVFRDNGLRILTQCGALPGHALPG